MRWFCLEKMNEEDEKQGRQSRVIVGAHCHRHLCFYLLPVMKSPSLPSKPEPTGELKKYVGDLCWLAL